MGFNISGVVINKNLQHNLELLQQIGLRLEHGTEINYEQASANYKDDGICDVYFGDQGTLLFASPNHCMDIPGIEGCNVLTWIVSEFAMAFSFRYYEGREEVRSFYELNGEMQWTEGNPLPVEEGASDGSEVIWRQVEVVMSKSFWDVEPDEKAFRYKIA